MPVRKVIAKILNRRRHDITSGGVWLRRPAGVNNDAGAGSVKDTAVGGIDDGNVSNINYKVNLTAVPAEVNVKTI